MKKSILFALVICFCCLMSACCMNHDWEDATCDEPEKCSKCGETRGEALGHDWKDATCTEPKTCSRCDETKGKALGHELTAATCTESSVCTVCGETEGEPLGHDWIDASYQQPKTCSVCGETEGEVLTPDYVTYGLNSNMVLGETYDYSTCCYDDADIPTVGKVTVTSYETIEPDAEHEAIDGYEWRRVSFEILFSDDNAWEYGYYVFSSINDYYDIEGFDDIAEWNDDDTMNFTINTNGESYDQCFMIDVWNSGEWNSQSRTCTFTEYMDIRIPVGYDGIVLTLIDGQTTWEDGMYIYDVANENTLFFRLS